MIWVTANRHWIARHDKLMQSKQRLRMKRFGMAFYTYLLVTLATVMVTWLGLGTMDAVQWSIFIGVGFLNNGVCFLLFYSDRNLHFSDPSLTREQIILSAFWGAVALYFLPEARPILLMFFLPAFGFGMLRLTRRQYLVVVGIVMGLYAGILALTYRQDPTAFRLQFEAFLFAIYGILLIWFAIFGGFMSSLRKRLQQQNKNIQLAHEKIRIRIEERDRAEKEKDQLIIELKTALAKVKTLSGLLPICASCKKIRDDRGYWKQIETYIRDHSEADFSHSICPECSQKIYPDLCNGTGDGGETPRA